MTHWRLPALLALLTAACATTPTVRPISTVNQFGPTTATRILVPTGEDLPVGTRIFVHLQKQRGARVEGVVTQEILSPRGNVLIPRGARVILSTNGHGLIQMAHVTQHLNVLLRYRSSNDLEVQLTAPMRTFTSLGYRHYY
jgi:hypothetical protein